MSSPIESLRVLVVEDDARLAEMLRQYLAEHSITAVLAHDGRSALRAARRGRFDAVVLDWMLPQGDGIEVCRQLRRESDVPILLLSARAEPADRVAALDAGADDYITKPFSGRELVARIGAQVRRARGQVAPTSHRTVHAGRLSLDLSMRAARFNGREIHVTGHEAALLLVLMERAGRVVTREELLDRCRGTTHDAFDRSIDVRIFRLRKKFGDDPRAPRLLKTVRGVGYVLVAP